MIFRITDIFYYPVKSLKPVSVSEVVVDDFGIRHDRRFMLIDGSNNFVTQRSHPKLSFILAEFSNEELILSSKELGVLTFNLAEFVSERLVRVWVDTLSCMVVDNERTRMISAFLGEDVRLAYMPDSAFRQVDKTYFDSEQRVSFADGFPFLLTNQASLEELNSRLKEPVNMARFRPNIVFSGDEAYQEDGWSSIQVGDITFEVVKPCSRCVMTTVDSSGRKSKEPLRTLSMYRKNRHGVCFGQNMVHKQSGLLRVGDALQVLK